MNGRKIRPEADAVAGVEVNAFAQQDHQCLPSATGEHLRFGTGWLDNHHLGAEAGRIKRQVFGADAVGGQRLRRPPRVAAAPRRPQ